METTRMLLETENKLQSYLVIKLQIASLEKKNIKIIKYTYLIYAF